jgi:NADH:ubiquinone oxidoreductase subunit 4 (subunit M)
MSFLTVMELLPLLGAALIATVNKDKEDAIKKMAFLTTLIVAVAGIALTTAI